MNLEVVDKAGIWSLMHWSNQCVLLTCTSHRKNMAHGTTCRWVKSSVTSEIQSYMNWHKALTASAAHMDSAIYNLHHNLWSQHMGPTEWHTRDCHAQQQWHDGQQEEEPTCNLSEKSPMFCPGDNHNPLPQKLLPQIKNYMLKSNSQNIFFHSLSTGAILNKRPSHKENSVQATF